MFHDLPQRCVPSPSTAFRGSTISRLYQWRLRQRKRWRMSLHNPLGNHVNFPSPSPCVVHVNAEALRWTQQVFLYPLHNLNLWNFLKKNVRLYCRNDLCGNNLPREEVNQRSVCPEGFPERLSVLAQQGFPRCSGSSPLQQSVPDGLGCTQAQQTRQGKK